MSTSAVVDQFVSSSERVRIAVEELLKRSPGQLTEANLLVVAAAKDLLDDAGLVALIEQVPTLPSSLRVTKPELAFLKSAFAVVLKGYEPSKRIDLIADLIVSGSAEALSGLPGRLHSPQTRAFSEAQRNRTSHLDLSDESYADWADGYRSDISRERALELTTKGGFAAWKILESYPFDTADFELLASERADHFIDFGYLAANPKLPTHLADRYLAQGFGYYETSLRTGNFSPDALHAEIVRQIDRDASAMNRTLHGLLKNPAVSRDTLTHAWEHVPKSAESLRELIAEHPNQAPDWVNTFALHRLTAKDPDVSNAWQLLKPLGSPLLSHDLAEGVYQRYGRVALEELHLSDELVDAAAPQDISELARWSDRVDVLERFAERGRLTETDWLMLATRRQDHVTRWAASTEYGPTDLSIKHPAQEMAIVTAKAASRPDIELPDPLFLARWEDLPGKNAVPFELPKAVTQTPLNNAGKISIELIRSKYDLARLPEYEANKGDLETWIRDGVDTTVLAHVNDGETSYVAVVLVRDGRYEPYSVLNLAERAWASEHPEAASSAVVAVVEQAANAWTAAQRSITLE